MQDETSEGLFVVLSKWPVELVVLPVYAPEIRPASEWLTAGEVEFQ